MNLEIGGKNYELRFGLSFINEIDNLYTQSMNGIEFGMGIEMMSSYLGLRRPTALNNVIKAGVSHLNSKPSNADIEAYLEGVFEAGKHEELFKEIEVATEQAPFLKQTIKGLKAEEKHQTKPTKK